MDEKEIGYERLDPAWPDKSILIDLMAVKEAKAQYPHEALNIDQVLTDYKNGVLIHNGSDFSFGGARDSIRPYHHSIHPVGDGMIPPFGTGGPMGPIGPTGPVGPTGPYAYPLEKPQSELLKEDLLQAAIIMSSCFPHAIVLDMEVGYSDGHQYLNVICIYQALKKTLIQISRLCPTYNNEGIESMIREARTMMLCSGLSKIIRITFEIEDESI